MAKFKVGDRVMMKFNTGRITRIAWNEFGYKSAEPAVVAAVDNGDIYFKYRVLLDNKNPTDYGYWWAAESELSPLAPAVPDGWTSADEPPINDHDVRVRYCVAADLPTSITVWHDTFESADAEAQRLCVKYGKPFRVLKVVEEVKPAEPEVIRIEE